MNKYETPELQVIGFVANETVADDFENNLNIGDMISKDSQIIG